MEFFHAYKKMLPIFLFNCLLRKYRNFWKFWFMIVHFMHLYVLNILGKFQVVWSNFLRYDEKILKTKFQVHLIETMKYQGKEKISSWNKNNYNLVETSIISNMNFWISLLPNSIDWKQLYLLISSLHSVLYRSTPSISE